jgi:ABC-type Co2+ transport system permease subunit
MDALLAWSTLALAIGAWIAAGPVIIKAWKTAKRKHTNKENWKFWTTVGAAVVISVMAVGMSKPWNNE